MHTNLASHDTMPKSRTSLSANETVSKSHPRIELRGKLDSLNAQIIFLQTLSRNEEYISDLEELRGVVRQLQRCEACDDAFAGGLELWGMTEDEIHSRSHNPKKYYGLGHLMPRREMATESAGLNLLRTLVREIELCAWRVFSDDELGLCHILNRLSSAIYILTYKYLPKDFHYDYTFG